MKEKVIEYEYEVNDEENNIDFNNNNNPINNNVNINYNNTNYHNIIIYTINNNINTQEPEIKSNNENISRDHLNQAHSQNNREQLEINMTDNTNGNIKKEDFNTSKNIRKFKKAVRKINKLKKLFQIIDKETNEDLDRLRMKNIVPADLLFFL